MKRIVLGVVLDVIAILGLMFFVVLPTLVPIETIPGLSSTLQNMLCTKPEIINVQRDSYENDEGGTSYTANFYCTYETRTRDVTGRAVILGIVIFTIPLIASIFLFISGTVSFKKNMLSAGMYNDSSGGFSMTGSDEGFARTSTTERLRVLKRAYDEGLINESEYETKRQAILSEM